MDADVVVIGAGAAGLAAARSLAERSLRVILLEGRDRVGGRVWSRTMTRSVVPAELGAEFIHGPAEETMTLVRKAGTAAIDSTGESWLYRAGKLSRGDDDFKSVPEVFEESRSLAEDESLDHFLRRFSTNGAMRRTAAAARAFAEGFDAADPAIASVRAIADEWKSGVDSTTARPLGGYPPLFRRLRESCAAAGVQTQLSTIVRHISWQPGAVTVEATNGSGRHQTLRARAAIVTLPAGVLRHRGDENEIVFDPVLPATKLDALDKIEMGQVVKIALLFRTAFWERISEGRYRDAAFFRCEDQPFGAFWTQYPVRSELIVAWAAGPKVIALHNASQTELIELARDGFASLFDEPAQVQSEFESGFMHDWARDPFSRGAYSYLRVGAGDARIALAAPVDGTLFFAGEATSSDGQGGTVNGALETGERAGREAAAWLRATNAETETQHG
jgi:monoamine oxidase